MNDSDSMISDDLTSSILARATKPLFKQSASAEERSDNVTWFAVTVNPDPFVKLNKKAYCKYSYEQQVAILTRIEAAMRRDNPSLKMERLYFEMCPKSLNAHYHAVYCIPMIFLSTMENYLRHRLMRTNGPSWRMLVAEPIYDLAGWNKYITKDVILT